MVAPAGGRKARHERPKELSRFEFKNGGCVGGIGLAHGAKWQARGAILYRPIFPADSAYSAPNARRVHWRVSMTWDSISKQWVEVVVVDVTTGTRPASSRWRRCDGGGTRWRIESSMVLNHCCTVVTVFITADAGGRQRVSLSRMERYGEVADRLVLT